MTCNPLGLAGLHILHHPVVLVLVVAAVVGAPSSAFAQSSRPRHDPAEIQRKIEKSAALQRQALQNLTDPGRAAKLVQSAYAELSAAQGNMIINASEMKFHDPLFDLNTRKTREALSLLQQASDALTTNRQTEAPTGSPPSLEVVRNNLQQALRLTNSVVAY